VISAGGGGGGAVSCCSLVAAEVTLIPLDGRTAWS
jgi:hypothetical protein